MKVAGLHIYPVKGCRGVSLGEVELTRRGFRYDRRWMVTDLSGEFLSQREIPEMCLIRTRMAGDAVELSAPGRPPFLLPLVCVSGKDKEVRVWNDTCQVLEQVDASDWMSDTLGQATAVVYMPEGTERAVNPARAEPGAIVSFADGYPVLMTSYASLDDLNRRLGVPLDMERFRPNLVIDGDSPYAEDRLASFEISGIHFRNAKGCDRCQVTTIDPETAVRGKEPLRTLAEYRKVHGKVWFGVNLVPSWSGAGRVLRTGDVLSNVELQAVSVEDAD